MWKKIRRVLMIVLAAVFLFCGGTVAVVQHQYNVSKRLYRAASDTFTSAASAEELTAEQTPAAAPAPEESARPSRSTACRRRPRSRSTSLPCRRSTPTWTDGSTARAP